MQKEALDKMAEKFGLTKISIEELIEYRLETEKQVELKAQAKLPTKYGEFNIYGFQNKITEEVHIALTKGEFKENEEVLCRVHSKCLTGDVFSSLKCDCGEQLEIALKTVSKEGKGI